ncbi:MAG: hypothetical protein GC185_04385 [Alphaproteobacteria bacterium]|nr:hypothetical protein [Alphaproteobacteria bacterium]
MVLRASPAAAQCELPGTTMATAAGIVTADTASLNGQFLAPVGALPVIYEAQLYIAQSVLYTKLSDQEDTILKRMDDFWTDWLKALQDMTAQINASKNDTVRQTNSLFDSSDENKNARDMQELEAKARKQFQPNDPGCRFDSMAPYMATTTRTLPKVVTALGNDQDDLGSAKKGTPAAKGPGEVQKVEWANYVALFCNPDANGGSAGCTTAGAMEDADVLPSKTLLGNLTYDFSSGSGATVDGKTLSKGQVQKVALDTLLRNITGYQPAVPVPTDALKNAAQQQRRLAQRGYSAQMNTVMALADSIEAEHTPGPDASEVQALRQRMGVTTPSANPSARELRQAVLEQLWDPAYYVGLGDAPATATQKEVYLEAYNLMLLYKLVDKEEKISNVYAVEAANTLAGDQGGQRDANIKDMPLHP